MQAGKENLYNRVKEIYVKTRKKLFFSSLLSSFFCVRVKELNLGTHRAKAYYLFVCDTNLVPKKARNIRVNRKKMLFEKHVIVARE